MTTLEKWAKEWCDQNLKTEPIKVFGMIAFMAGYNLAVKHANAPKKKCPPGHNCPDCGSSIVDESVCD
jgi:hypothetical protein